MRCAPAGAPCVERVHPPVIARGAAGASSRSRCGPKAPCASARRCRPTWRSRRRRRTAISRASWSRYAAGATLLPPVGVRATGALGLGAWHHRAGGEAEVLVYPDLVGARRLAAGGSARPAARVGTPGARRPYGLGTAFEAVREYTPDDDVRQINWRATARLGRPMSNQYRIDQDSEVRCLLDAGRLSAAACARRHPARRGAGWARRGLRDRRRARRSQRRARVRRSRAARRCALAARCLRRRARALRRRAGRCATATTSSRSARVAGGKRALRPRARRPGRRGRGARARRCRARARAPPLRCASRACATPASTTCSAGSPTGLRDAYAMTVALEMRRVRALAARRVARRRRHGRRGAARALRRCLRQRVRAGEGAGAAGAGRARDEAPVEPAQRDPDRDHDRRASTCR